MPTYSYICRHHRPALIIENEQSIAVQVPGVVSCPKCGREARRHYPGQRFYAKVSGGHGGGPATK